MFRLRPPGQPGITSSGLSMRYHEDSGGTVISPKSKAPAQTFEEAKYLRRLAEEHQPVSVKLESGEVFSGVIEFWDTDFIRLNREDGPNLFIYKHDIRYLWEDNG